MTMLQTTYLPALGSSYTARGLKTILKDAKLHFYQRLLRENHYEEAI